MERAAGAPQIAIVTIDRPQQRNAFNDLVISELANIAGQLREMTDVRCVIVTGAGGFFSAGADLASFAAVRAETDLNRVRRMVEKGGMMCAAWEQLPQLTIAAIDGGAVGGGLGLSLACDWRVMAEDAWIYVPEARLGLNFGWNTLPRLNALVGPARTKTISVLCHRHPATECLAWGLTDRLGPPGDAMSTARELADEVCNVPRMAAQIIKRSVNANAYALTAATSYADMEDMLVCLSDEEGQASAREVVKQVIG
jgi:enoyl-CoA hydratase/carnithine racemase